MSNDQDFKERFSALEEALVATEFHAADAVEVAKKWATECEHMMSRITALERQVEELTKQIPKKKRDAKATKARH